MSKLLLSLDIQDFGLVDRLYMDFSSGLNVLSGETGAGKSIIIDALQMLLGFKTSADLIRTGREKARVTAVFETGKLEGLQARLKDWGIPPEEDGTILMTRELVRNGRNTCRLNGQVVTLSLYREAARCLADLQSQHEQQSLLSPHHQLSLLDSYGGATILNMRSKTGELHKPWRTAKEKLDALLRGSRDRVRRLDMLIYQVEEIKKATLKPDEDEELLKERNLLANAEKIMASVENCYTCLYGGEAASLSSIDYLGRAARILAELGRLDGSFKPLLAIVENAYYQLEGIRHELAGYREQINSDPERLQLIEERLFLIKGLKRKYGNSIAEIQHYLDQAEAEIESLTNNEVSTAALEKEILTLEGNWRQTAKELSLLRQETARQLERSISEELESLEMKRVDFYISFGTLPDFSPSGQDSVEFLFSPNPGEPLRPLSRIASGGELSRIMLAIRTILAGVDRIPTLIFDEIDTGIGGKTLHAVAEKLARLAVYNQIICVTHAAQVACRADSHFYVFKETEGARTATRVEPLQDELRLKELARMLTGKTDGPALEHTRQMLEQFKPQI